MIGKLKTPHILFISLAIARTLPAWHGPFTSQVGNGSHAKILVASSPNPDRGQGDAPLELARVLTDQERQV